MNAAKTILAVVLVLALCYGFPALFLISQTDFGIAIAVAATCWLLIELLCFVERQRDTRRLGREAVWLRRDREAM
jgi:hypothetical protein